MISISLPREIENRLSYLGKISKKSESFYIEKALTRNWEDLEDLAAIERYLSTPESERKYYTSEEVDQILAEEDV